MSFESLPSEILHEIFSKSECWNTLALVCKRWKGVVEELHIFEKSTCFVKSRSTEEYSIAEKSKRKFNLFVLFLPAASNSIMIESFSKIVGNPGSIENVEIGLREEFTDYVEFILILEQLQSVKGIKILSCTRNPPRKPIENIHLKKYINLKSLEIIQYRQGFSFMDFIPNLMEVPALEKFIFKCHYFKFKDFERGIEFAIKCGHQLKHIHIGGYDFDAYLWPELLWTEDTLLLSQFNKPSILKNFKKFLEVHADQDFSSKLQHLVIYGSSLPKDVGKTLFRCAKNIEALSTDLNIPTYVSSDIVYQNLKILKLESFSPSKKLETVHVLMKLFPSMEIFLTCEKLSKNSEKLFQSSFKNLKEVKHSMIQSHFDKSFPNNQHLFEYDMCGWYHNF